MKFGEAEKKLKKINKDDPSKSDKNTRRVSSFKTKSHFYEQILEISYDETFLGEVNSTSTQISSQENDSVHQHNVDDVDNVDTGTQLNISFIKYSRTKKDEFESVFEEHILGLEYKPVDNQFVRRGWVLLPSGIEEYGTDRQLINDISNFLYKYFDPPEFYKQIIPYIILYYWISDKFKMVNLVHFVGRTGTGKTTAADVMGSICYKPINAMGAITKSALFRITDMWNGTIILNEVDPNDKELLPYLRSGTEDKPLFQTVDNGKVKEVIGYSVKCPKIMASHISVMDAGLQSRTIAINMKKNTVEIPLFRLQSFNDGALKLRNKLLLWRLRHLDKINLEEIEFGFPELKKFDRRVQQILTPIYYLADEEGKKAIEKLMKEHEEETKEERLEELEGRIFIRINEIIGFENYTGKIYLKDITKLINDDLKYQGSKKEYKERQIGKEIKILFSIKGKFKREGVGTYFEPDKEKINELKDYFGLKEDQENKKNNNIEMKNEEEESLYT